MARIGNPLDLGTAADLSATNCVSYMMVLFIEDWHWFTTKFNTSIVNAFFESSPKIVTWNMLLAPCLTYWTLRLAGRIRLICLRQAARPRVCNYEGFFPSLTVKCLGLCHGLEIFLKLGPDRMHARGKLESCTGLPTHPAPTSHMSRGKSWDEWWTKKYVLGTTHGTLYSSSPSLHLTFLTHLSRGVSTCIAYHCLSYCDACGDAFMREPPCSCFTWEICHSSVPEP